MAPSLLTVPDEVVSSRVLTPYLTPRDAASLSGTCRQLLHAVSCAGVWSRASAMRGRGAGFDTRSRYAALCVVRALLGEWTVAPARGSPLGRADAAVIVRVLDAPQPTLEVYEARRATAYRSELLVRASVPDARAALAVLGGGVGLCTVAPTTPRNATTFPADAEPQTWREARLIVPSRFPVVDADAAVANERLLVLRRAQFIVPCSPTPPPGDGMDLSGMWVSRYQGHGWELMRATYVAGALVVLKVVGDGNVPDNRPTVVSGPRELWRAPAENGPEGPWCCDHAECPCVKRGSSDDATWRLDAVRAARISLALQVFRNSWWSPCTLLAYRRRAGTVHEGDNASRYAGAVPNADPNADTMYVVRHWGGGWEAVLRYERYVVR